MNAVNGIDMQNARQIGAAIKAAASAGLTVQSYCISAQQQPLFLFPEDLKAKLPDVNTYLRTAQGNAGNYLNTIQPQIIGVIADVGAFSTQFPVFANSINGYISAWNAGSIDNKKKALAAIKVLEDTVDQKIAKVAPVCIAIGNVQQAFNGDVSNFKTASQACTDLITGDKGELQEIKAQVSSIDGKIGGAAAGVGLSGLAIIGGVFMILVGSIATFFTAGTSTPLVVAGGILTATGAAGMVASSVVLAGLIKEKGDLLRREATLNSYAALMEGCKSNMNLLYTGAQDATAKLTTMKTSWEFLSSDLKKVKEALDGAQQYSELPFIVQDFFATAEKQWKDVGKDIDAIKGQMAGVEVKPIPTANANGLRMAGCSETFGEINEDTVKRMLA